MTLSILLCLIGSWLFIRYAGAQENPPGNNWYVQWQRWLQPRLSIWTSRIPVAQDIQSALQFVVIALLPALLFGFVINIVGGWLWGFIGFLLSLMALFFSCGRTDYDTEMIRLSDAAQQCTDSSPGTDKKPDYPPYLAYASYDRWFGAAFWFLVFGPVLAVIYRCIALLVNSETELENDPAATSEAAGCDEEQYGVEEELAQLENPLVTQSETATVVLSFLDWLPVRLWGFIIMLMGDFSAGWGVYREYFFRLDNAGLLHKLTIKCLPQGSRTQAEWLEDILGLSDRVMLVALVFVCLPVIF